MFNLNFVKTFSLLNDNVLHLFLYRLEIHAVTFFTLQNICEHLKNEKVNESSLILSKFNVESIISLIDSRPDLSFESIYEESAKLITFKRYKKVIEVPSENINKYAILFIFNYYLFNFNFSLKF